jgi:hypothetical protein
MDMKGYILGLFNGKRGVSYQNIKMPIKGSDIPDYYNSYTGLYT